MAPPTPALADLLAIAAEGDHAASDYLEDAVLAGVRTVGCRRVGGGLTGAPWASNVPAGAALAASSPAAGALIFEGSGSCIPPVEVDRTVCVIGPASPEPLADYALMRARAAARSRGRRGAGGRGALHAAPRASRAAAGRRARGAVHHGRPRCDGVEPLVASTNLARRSALADDLERAAAERCDVYLTELKAAAIDTVAHPPSRRGARSGVRAQPAVGVDDALMELAGGA